MVKPLALVIAEEIKLAPSVEIVWSVTLFTKPLWNLPGALPHMLGYVAGSSRSVTTITQNPSKIRSTKKKLNYQNTYGILRQKTLIFQSTGKFSKNPTQASANQVCVVFAWKKNSTLSAWRTIISSTKGTNLYLNAAMATIVNKAQQVAVSRKNHSVLCR